MRYKYNPNSPCKWGRALKIYLIHEIKKALQVAKANIIKYMEPASKAVMKRSSRNVGAYL